MLVLLLLPAGVATASVAPDQQDFAELDAFVEQTMRASGLPGVALAIVRGDQVLHTRGFGVADAQGRAVTPQTLFLIGSNSKSFTALAIMQLVERGQIDLDARVQKYLPWFKLADPEASGRITVQQLLNHTSGIPGSALYSSWATPELTLQQYGLRMAEVSPDRAVGSSFEYSNANYNLAGLIVEAVSNQSYAEYIEQHIFQPLGMHHSAATRDTQLDLDLADGHQWWFGVGPFPRREMYSQANLPSAFLASTAEDMSHYLVAQLNGGRYGSAHVLSEGGIKRMHTIGPNTENIAAPEQHGGAGLGWVMTQRNGVPLVTHSGETFSFKSLQVLDEQNGLGFVLLTNASNQLPSMDQPYRALYDGILTRLEGWDSSATGLDLHAMYAMLDVVLLVLTTGILLVFVRLPVWAHNFERRNYAPGRRLRLSLTLVRIAIEIVAPLAMLVLVPRVLAQDSGWPVVLQVTPDLGSWMIVASGLLLVVGIALAVLLVRVLSRPQHSAVMAQIDLGDWASA